MSNAAIYARVSSARQKEQQTIGSQTAALHAHAGQLGLDVPPQWVFCDEGHSGATLVRPALEKLRDLVAQLPVEVVLVYSPDRLARKYAYQALLIEEFARAGASVVFIKGPSSDTPEDALLVQFQGMIAEYERAQIIERTRRGKAHRARQGTVNVLSGAPFGYRYVRKNEHADARYEIVPHEAAIVAELFRCYVEDGAAIADLARWLTATGVPTRTGKSRWDRSVIWAMLRNPAYAGRACFGKTMRTADQPGLNRVARLQGRCTPRPYSVKDRDRGDWLEIPVPAIVAEDTWQRVQRRLEDNKRYAARNSKVPSLLQGLAACSSCGYAYYRGHTTTTAGNKIYYYRCLGSDNYRYEHGRVCDNKPVRTDYLDQVVWDHITSLLASPQLIRAEIDRRLQQLRTADPTTARQQRLQQALSKSTAAITRLIKAYQEELITLDELRERMPGLRARELSLRSQLGALAAQLTDRDAYLKLADDLEGFLARLRRNAGTATPTEQQRVLRLIVKDVLIGPERIVIRHSIPAGGSITAPAPTAADSDDDEEPAQSSPLRWWSHHAALWGSLLGRRESLARPEHACLQPRPDQVPGRERPDDGEKVAVVDAVERRGQVRIQHPRALGPGAFAHVVDRCDRVLAAPARPEPIRSGLEPGLPLWLQRVADPRLMTPVHDHWNAERAELGTVSCLRNVHAPDRTGTPRRTRLVHPHRHLRPGLGSQRDLPVDPGGLAPGVALRHLPHADQRAGAAAQHQLLQVPDLRPVLLPHRLEDPLPQPPYVPLAGTPVNGVPLQHALRSVHRHRRLTCPSVLADTICSSSTAHLPTSARFRARAPGPVSGQL
jgi:site-specific DNA recombinase